MWEYLRKHVRYPTSMEGEGMVFIQFTVETDGTLTGIHIKRGVAQALDNEALRVVSSFPKWTPSMIDGKPVRQDYIVPIRFRIH